MCSIDVLPLLPNATLMNFIMVVNANKTCHVIDQRDLLNLQLREVMYGLDLNVSYRCIIPINEKYIYHQEEWQ